LDLKDFVADVVSQLTDGVIEAINRHDAKQIPGRINPIFEDSSGAYDWKGAVQNIEFDISVVVSEKKSGAFEAGAKVFVADLGGKRSKSHEDTMTNRIKFTIPVSLPAHKVPEQK
jgi:hypothetical protein